MAVARPVWSLARGRASAWNQRNVQNKLGNESGAFTKCNRHVRYKRLDAPNRTATLTSGQVLDGTILWQQQNRSRVEITSVDQTMATCARTTASELTGSSSRHHNAYGSPASQACTCWPHAPPAPGPTREPFDSACPPASSPLSTVIPLSHSVCMASGAHTDHSPGNSEWCPGARP